MEFIYIYLLGAPEMVIWSREAKIEYGRMLANLKITFGHLLGKKYYFYILPKDGIYRSSLAEPGGGIIHFDNLLKTGTIVIMKKKSRGKGPIEVAFMHENMFCFLRLPYMIRYYKESFDYEKVSAYIIRSEKADVFCCYIHKMEKPVGLPTVVLLEDVIPPYLAAGL